MYRFSDEFDDFQRYFLYCGRLKLEQLRKLKEYIENKKDILILGYSGSGKTLLLNGLIELIDEKEKILYIGHDELFVENNNIESLELNKFELGNTLEIENKYEETEFNYLITDFDEELPKHNKKNVSHITSKQINILHGLKSIEENIKDFIEFRNIKVDLVIFLGQSKTVMMEF